MHHKRHRPKNTRAGCLFCKPHKMNGWPKRVKVRGYPTPVKLRAVEG